MKPTAMTLAAAALLGACGGGAGLSDAGATFPKAPFMNAVSDSGGLHLALRSIPQPPARGKNTLRVNVTDDGGAAVSGLTLAVQPWMPDMDHGSAIVPSVTAEDGGVYQIGDLYFPMPGSWELRIAITGKEADHAEPSFLVP